MPTIPDKNYTKLQNELLDLLASGPIGYAEMRVTLNILRETNGWQREEVALTYGELESLAGLSRASVAAGLKSGIARGTIQRTATKEGFTYSLTGKVPSLPDTSTGSIPPPSSVQGITDISPVHLLNSPCSNEGSETISGEVQGITDISPVHLLNLSVNPDSSLTEPSAVHLLNYIKEERKSIKKEYITDTENPTSEEPTQTELPIDAPVNRKPKKPKEAKQTKEPTDHLKLMTAYEDALGYKISSYGKEGTGAKRILQMGYTIEQAIACYRHLKQDSWFGRFHISLQTVAEQLGTFLTNQQTSAQIHISPVIQAQATEPPLTKQERADRWKRIYAEQAKESHTNGKHTS